MSDTDLIIATNVPGLDAGEMMRALGVRGGGRPEWARGGGAYTREEIEALYARALEYVERWVAEHTEAR